MTHVLRSPGPADYDAIASWIQDAAQCVRWGGPHIPFPFSGAELPGLIASAPAIVPGEISASFSLISKLGFIEAQSHTGAEFMAMQKSITRIER